MITRADLNAHVFKHPASACLVSNSAGGSLQGKSTLNHASMGAPPCFRMQAPGARGHAYKHTRTQQKQWWL